MIMTSLILNTAQLRLIGKRNLNLMLFLKALIPPVPLSTFDMQQPRGKQRWCDENYQCWYVQTTGLWKTVWTEYVPKVSLNPDQGSASDKAACHSEEYFSARSGSHALRNKNRPCPLYDFSDYAVEEFTREWLEIVKQNYNHPCIITWTPFNESWGISQVETCERQQRIFLCSIRISRIAK